MKDSIPFRDVMCEWLYNKESGYYTRNNVGRNGDFYTSVSVSKFFGGAIARYILRLLDEKKLTLPLYIVEIGSNNGDLLCDIAEFIKAFSNIVFQQTHFCIIEPLESLHALQAANFESRITARFHKNLHIYTDLDTLQANATHNIFFVANELFDSMPCDVIYDEKMLFIEGGQCKWHEIDSKTKVFRQKYAIQGAEIPLFWESFIQKLCAFKQAFVFLTFDYGDFVARDMNIRLYQKHKVYNLYEEAKSGRLLDFFGRADITYDVDFSLLTRMFESCGATLLCNLTQARFLIELCEIIDIFESFSVQFHNTQQIKQGASLQGLIAPNAMGERFKALCVGNI